MTCRKIFEYLSHIDSAATTPQHVLAPYIAKIGSSDSASRIIISMMSDFTHAIDEVSQSRLSATSRERHIARLKDISESLIGAFQGMSGGKQFGQYIRLGPIVDYIETLVDAVEQGDEEREIIPSIDRAAIIASIDELVTVVSNSKLDRMAKKAITIQLSSIQKICLETAVFSDAELRLRVKATMADLVVSWAAIRAEDEDVAEKVQAWVWGAAIKVRSGLGLASDITQLTALSPRA